MEADRGAVCWVCRVTAPMSTRSLVCTFCAGQISPTLEYTPRSYSEHRDHTGYECDDCAATWDTTGEVTTSGVARCLACAHPFSHNPNCWCGCESVNAPLDSASTAVQPSMSRQNTDYPQDGGMST